MLTHWNSIHIYCRRLLYCIESNEPVCHINDANIIKNDRQNRRKTILLKTKYSPTISFGIRFAVIVFVVSSFMIALNFGHHNFFENKNTESNGLSAVFYNWECCTEFVALQSLEGKKKPCFFFVYDLWRLSTFLLEFIFKNKRCIWMMELTKYSLLKLKNLTSGLELDYRCNIRVLGTMKTACL